MRKNGFTFLHPLPYLQPTPSAKMYQNKAQASRRHLNAWADPAAIVSAADKYSAVKDIIKGSEVKETGVKYYVRDEKEKIRNLLKG